MTIQMDDWISKWQCSILVQLATNQVMEMVNSDALVPLNDTIKTIEKTNLIKQH